MRIQAVAWALEQYIPTPIAKLVLVSLANHANHETGECWPKIETIAHECSCSIRSVQRYVRVLEEKGLVRVEPRFIKGRQDSSFYWLQIPGANFQRREHRRGDRLSPHGSRHGGKPQSFVTPGGATAVAPFNNQQNRHSPNPPPGLVVENARPSKERNAALFERRISGITISRNSSQYPVQRPGHVRGRNNQTVKHNGNRYHALPVRLRS